MNTGNGLLIVLLLIGIIVVANGMMFLAVRRSVRGDKTTRSFISGAQDALGKPFQKENKSLEELRKRVEELEEIIW
ncbi:MAG: hypothetical protein COS37_00865 [Anaerolineae bacterium CG03_land_8_20_14_0_80_58_20]|nr:MAG: hypothetical protein AUJ21_01125 [Anaerolineae bacterium CG1_02_58_13]PIV28491.1 MAG: hypothetical protein COS37_00865 [Anaerolineae bacterium CG03_land_8_20_14_0_80_58_20]